ncbi:ATP-binding cassette domain-containing protein [Labilithrix luteola]|uniref:ATP-binding cassette domain-containing protein n=1 Tax=Labilithrix luteola TaxID=1391654 RepID=UPI0014742AFC|nr:ATP-binding cassette domain-containing protein [Labilithrix luteola]
MDRRSMDAIARFGGGDALLGIAIVGTFAALAKLAGGTLAAWSEARMAGEVAGELRLEVLQGVLGRSRACRLARDGVHRLQPPRHADHGSRAQREPGEAKPTLRVERAAELASLTSHVQDVERGVAQGVFAEIRAMVQLLPLAALLVALAPRLAGSALVVLGAFAAVVLVARRALKRGKVRAAHEAERLLGAADEAVRHADLWASYGAERRIVAHVALLGRAIADSAARLRARTAVLSATSEVLGAMALVLTMALVSGGMVGGVDRGTIVPFAIAFFMAYRPIREFVEARLARGRAEEALAAATSVATTAGAREDDAGDDRARAKVRAWEAAPLVIEGLVARHGSHAPLSLAIDHGSIAAIVGPTGIGKTSLLRALLGLEETRSGTVRYGTADLGERGVGPGERPFAWVPQEAPVLGDTLTANVSLGRPEGAGSGIDYLDMLGAGALAASLGEAVLSSTRAVSGGERQWIAVARALATELPVLLLDEPTSSLDPTSQDRMLEALARLRGKRTILVVTHRPEPLAIADVIVRLRPVASEADDADDRPSGDRNRVAS